MEQLSKSRNVWSFVLPLSLAVALCLTGCGPSRKQADSDALRQASQQARSLHDQAEAKIANPPLEGGRSAESDAQASREALDLLSQAEQTLNQALQEHYTARQGSAKPEEIATDAASVAKLTLGLVQHLTGQCYTWQASQNFARARQAMERADGQLGLIQQRQAGIRTLMKQLETSQETLQKDLTAAIEQRDEARETIKTTTAKIEKNDQELKQLEQTIAAQSERASKLKTEATLATGPKSLEKLEEALAVENTIHQARARSQELASEQTRLKTTLKQAEIRAENGAEKVQALEAIKQRRLAQAASSSEALQQARKQMDEAVSNLAEVLTEVGLAVQQGQTRCGEALQSVNQAEASITDAQSIAPENQKAVAYAEAGDVRAVLGEVNLRLWYIRQRLEALQNRLASVWQGLVDPPAQPTTPQIAAFIDATGETAQQASEAYSQAVELYNQAVRAADSPEKWRYQTSLAMGYVNYAKALDAAGLTAEANSARQNARELLPEVRRGAEAAGQPEAVAPLQDVMSSLGG